MVAKRGIISVFHHGHDLNGVVPGIDDLWQDVVFKLDVSRTFGLVRTHSDVTLVDPQVFGDGRCLMFPDVLLGRVPIDGVIEGVLMFLPYDSNPGGDSLDDFAVLCVDTEFDLGGVADGGLIVGAVSEENGPDTVLIFVKNMIVTVPSV